MESASKPLTACPCCASRLLYPVAFERHPDARRVVVERYCPECQHNDCVACDAVAAEVWARRERRIRLELVRTVLALELDEILAATTLS